MRRIALSLLFLVCQVLPGQVITRTDKTAFEVASLRPSPPVATGGHWISMDGGPGTKDPERISIKNYSLARLLTTAFEIGREDISGPGWIDEDKYDIVAKLPHGATRRDLLDMLQGLLIERFELRMHYQSKPGKVYQLLAGGGPLKLHLASPPVGGDPAVPFQRTLGKDGFYSLSPADGVRVQVMNGRYRMTGSNASIAEFAKTLEGIVKSPVRDSTSLGGRYDFVLYWGETEEPDGPEPDPAWRLIAAVRDELGLKLAIVRGERKSLVIDHSERVPADN
jgi:uncharacterized protein (TIGR03435 family)